MYVTDRQALEELVTRLRESDFVCMDTEFMRERTYYPRLCLIQVASEDVIALIDPLAFDELEPLEDLLGDPDVVKVLHSGVQDLEIFFYRMGRVPAPVFDTQVAATLTGHPQQVGYGALVKHVTGETIDKSDTFTDWSKRPLSDTQIDYALNDVRYLPGIYSHLREHLGAEGRLGWLEEDFARLEDPRSYEIVPEDMWRRVKRASSLNRRQLAVLREVVAWREREAQRRNLPRKWVFRDESLVEVARRAPKTRAELESIRGVTDKLAGRLYPAVLDAVGRGQEVPDERLPRLDSKAKRDISEGAVGLMGALVRFRAKQNKVAVPLLASREELERLASGERDDSPLLSGWRREIVGNDLLELLEGRLSLMIGDDGIVLVPVATDKE